MRSQSVVSRSRKTVPAPRRKPGEDPRKRKTFRPRKSFYRMVWYWVFVRIWVTLDMFSQPTSLSAGSYQVIVSFPHTILSTATKSTNKHGEHEWHRLANMRRFTGKPRKCVSSTRVNSMKLPASYSPLSKWSPLCTERQRGADRNTERAARKAGRCAHPPSLRDVSVTDHKSMARHACGLLG